MQTERIELYYQQGSSDKVYHLELENAGDNWSVNAQWGRRGSALKRDVKAGNVTYDEAKRVYDRILERAWVAVKRVGNPPENWVAEVSKGYVPGIVFEFGVHGKTVARITESRFALAIVPVRGNTPMPEPDLPLPPDYSAADSYNIAGESRMVVPPNGTFQMRCFLRPYPPTEEQLTGLRNRDVLMCVYGYVKYLDSFGKSRETRVCYVYDFIWGGVLTSPDGEILNPSGFRVGNLPEYNKAT
jgi:hypothetical protein